MKLELTIPSKTFLFGEYAVLCGGPALLVNTYPHFKMLADDGANKRNNSLHPNPLPRSGRGRQFNNFGRGSPEKTYWEANKTQFSHYYLEFIDPYGGKGGFGASSAKFCMLFALKSYITKSTFNIGQLLDEYRAYSWSGEGYPPSGADIISQLHGGIIYYHPNANIIKKFVWPFNDLSLCLIRTNKKVVTHCHLEKLTNLNTTDLERIVFAGISAFQNADKVGFCEAINAYATALLNKKLTCDETTELLSLLNKNPSVLAAKGCGALGADVICVILPKAKVADFCVWASSLNLDLICHNNFSSEGITIEATDVGSKQQVILVDNNDCQIGIEDKIVAHQRGLLHRAFSVFIFRKKNNQIEVLLQRRASNKYHCSGLWTNTCCSHPQPGEDIAHSAYKRLKIEMGMECPLQEVGVFTYKADVGNGLVEHEIDHIFVGKYQDTEIKVNDEEVQDYRWISLSELEDDMQINKDKYTPWLNDALQIIVEQNILGEYFN